MNHWVELYVGKPWTVDGFGPDAFNCWGLFWWVQNKHFKRDVPKYEQISADEMRLVAHVMAGAIRSGKWVRVEKPVDGCAVAMSQGKEIHHVGTFLDIDGGRILHAVKGKGVLCQSLPAVSVLWSRVEYYVQKC